MSVQRKKKTTSPLKRSSPSQIPLLPTDLTPPNEEALTKKWIDCMGNQMWRLEHLYWIENKSGHVQRFKMNAAQRRLHNNLWYRNDVLKARQLGISTYTALLMLDMCLFRHNFHCGIIDKTLPDAQQKLAKIRFAWEHLDYLATDPTPADIALAQIGSYIKSMTGVSKKSGTKLKTDARTAISWSNDSDVRIGTNLRGGTMQFLHVSELAHVSVHSPCRAREIRTGAINTVAEGGYIIKESTHEGGRYGVNYELTLQAMENSSLSELSKLDFKFFFFSWFDHESYSLNGRERWSHELNEYFSDLELKHSIALTTGQKRWYAHMSRLMSNSMKQEYPSTAQEALQSSEEGSIYGTIISQLREQGHLGITPSSDISSSPLFTSWDLGLSDHTAIWLAQLSGATLYWLDHYSANQKGLLHYAEKMKEWEQIYGSIQTHFLPHDAARRDPLGQSYVEHLARTGINNIRVVPRTTDIWLGINSLRKLLESSYFADKTMLRSTNAKGNSEPSALEHLELYRSKPPGLTVTLKEQPIHDEHSHTADAARTMAEAWQKGMLHPTPIFHKKRLARMS